MRNFVKLETLFLLNIIDGPMLNNLEAKELLPLLVLV